MALGLLRVPRESSLQDCFTSDPPALPPVCRARTRNTPLGPKRFAQLCLYLLSQCLLL